jgi:hypothetical protein
MRGKLGSNVMSLWLLLLVPLTSAGCRSIEVRPAPFRPPAQYAEHFESNGFAVAFVPILDKKASRECFNVDFTRSAVLPVRVIAQNNGNREILVDAKQIFGVTSIGDFYQSYDLDQSTRIIRRSQIGSGMATSAIVGAIAGGAIGAGIGAGIGRAAGGSGDTARGAEAGAIIGGTAGAAAGAMGRADETTTRIRREMRRADWGSQVVYPGEIRTGYVFLPREAFAELAFNLYDLIDRKPISASIPLELD